MNKYEITYKNMYSDFMNWFKVTLILAIVMILLIFIITVIRLSILDLKKLQNDYNRQLEQQNANNNPYDPLTQSQIKQVLKEYTKFGFKFDDPFIQSLNSCTDTDQLHERIKRKIGAS